MKYEQSKVEKCPICSKNDCKTTYNDLFDDRYAYPDLFTLKECDRCSSYYLENPVTPSQAGKLYENYYFTNTTSSKEKAKISTISNLLKKYKLKKIYDRYTGNINLGYLTKKTEKILDFGCGGTLNAEVANLDKNKRTWIEINGNIVQDIKDQWYKCYQWDLTSIDHIKEKFDIILMSQVIEHVYEPIHILENAKKLLNPGGRIIMSTPNNKSVFKNKYQKKRINRHTPYHTVLYSPETFQYIGKLLHAKKTSVKTNTPTARYLIQKNFSLPPKGEKNKAFKHSSSILKIVCASAWLHLHKLFHPKTGDCMYIELRF